MDNRGSDIRTVTIASGQTTSDVIDSRGMSLVALIFSAQPTGTSFSFLGSVDNVTFYPIKDASNAAVSVTVSGANLHTLNPVNFLSIPFLKIVSNASESAARTITAVIGTYTGDV